MTNYSSLIDPCDFGTIADYLYNPSSPIEFVLHVKSREMLAPLAEALTPEYHARLEPGKTFNPVESGLRDRSLLISPRYPPTTQDPEKFVDAANIPREALCYVIYAPPFYLAHTPGLFEGTLIKPKHEIVPGHKLHQRRGARMKI